MPGATSIRAINADVHVVSNPKVAEMQKLLENIFRSVNIALENELAQLCDRIGEVSMWEVIEAASTKPFGVMPFDPGPGLGGHCIPIDPHVLSYSVESQEGATIDLPSVDLTPEALQSCEVAVIITAHDDYDVERIARHAPHVVEARNAPDEIDAPDLREKITLLGGGKPQTGSKGEPEADPRAAPPETVVRADQARLATAVT